MFRELNRQTQQEFQNHQWGDDKSNRVIDIVTKHIEIISEIIKSYNPSITQICTNAKHLLIQLKYNITYAKKASTQPQNPNLSQPEDPKTKTKETEGIVNQLQKMRRLSVNRFLNQFHQKQNKKQSLLVPGSLNYHLKFQNKEVQTNLLQCQIETMVNQIQAYEIQAKSCSEFNDMLKKQNEEKRLELLSLNKTLMGILMEKAILEAQYLKIKELKPSIVEKIVIDYSEIEKRVNEGYESIIEKVIKYSAQNIFTKENNYSGPATTGKRRLKCGTILNMMILPKSKENLDILNQYYSNFQKNSLSLSETENLIKSLETKDQKIYELERKLGQKENLERQNSLKILKERALKKMIPVGRYEEKEVQTKIVFGVNDVLSKEQLKKIIYYQNHGGGQDMEGSNMHTQTEESQMKSNENGPTIEGRNFDQEFEELYNNDTNNIESSTDNNDQDTRTKNQNPSPPNRYQKRNSKDYDPSHPHNQKSQQHGLDEKSQEKNRNNKRQKVREVGIRKKSLVKASTTGGPSATTKQGSKNRRLSKKQYENSLVLNPLNQPEQNYQSSSTVEKRKKQQNNITYLLSFQQKAKLIRQQYKSQENPSRSKYAFLKQNINELQNRTKNIHSEMNGQQSQLGLIRNSNYSSKKIKKMTQPPFRQQFDRNREGRYNDNSLETEPMGYQNNNGKTVKIRQQEQNHYNIQQKSRQYLISQGQKQNYLIDKATNQYSSKLLNTKPLKQSEPANQLPRNTRNRNSKSKNSSGHNSKQYYPQQPATTGNYTEARKRIESLPVLSPEQSKQQKQNLRSSILPKLTKCNHQHQHSHDPHSQHDKLTHMQSRKIQQKIEKLQEEIQKSGKGRANNSRVELQKMMKLLETLHKTCGSDCKYLQRAWQSTYATPQNKRQLRIPKYDLVYDQEQQRKQTI